jgi:exodeoxyribonuclease VII small subunit
MTTPEPSPEPSPQTSGGPTPGAGDRADRFPDVEHLGYEQARDQLVDVVRRLEAGGATLEESLELWERGEALAARCEAWLSGARARVEAATGADRLS